MKTQDLIDWLKKANPEGQVEMYDGSTDTFDELLFTDIRVVTIQIYGDE